MAKFCSKCGKQLDEGVKFCSGCGAPIVSVNENQGQHAETQVPRQNALKYQPGTSKRTNRLIKKLVPVLIVACVLVVGGVSIQKSQGYKKPFKYLEQGVKELDMDILLKAFPPEEIYEGTELEDYVSGADMESELDYFNNMFASFDSDFELEIEGKEKISKDGLASTLRNDYGLETYEAKEADAAYNVSVNIVQKEADKEKSAEMLIIKIDGKWYVPVTFFY